MGNQLFNSIFLEHVSIDELDKIFKSLKKCAPGYDGITADILQLSFPFICNELFHLLNMSIE